MRGYNIWRPLMLLAVVFLTRSLVTNLCLLLGLTPDAASGIAMVAMLIAAFIMYNRMKRPRGK